MTEITIYSSYYGCELTVADRFGTILDEEGNEVGIVDVQRLLNTPQSEWEDIIEDSVDGLEPK